MSAVPCSSPDRDRGGYLEVLRIAAPLILSTASLTIALFVSRMLLSWHSPAAVAAATPGGITFFTICSFFMAIAEYVNTLVAQHHGAGNKPACARAVWQGLFFSLLSAPLIAALIPAGNLLLAWAGHSPEILALEQEYFTILMIGGVALPLNASLASFFSGRGKTMVVLWGNLIGNGANTLVAYVLIFGKLGFPEMGIRGAAIANTATALLPGLYWGALFLSRRYQPVFRTRKEFRWDRELFFMLMRYGAPAGTQFFLDVASFNLFVLLIGRLGALDLAAGNIALSIELLSFLPMVGMSIATATLVGEYSGRERPDIAERLVYSALKMALAYSLLFSALYLVFPEAFLRLFASESFSSEFQDISTKGVVLLRIVAMYTVFNNVFIVFCGALNGAGDTRFTMWTQIGLSWGLFVPAVYIVVNHLGWGIEATWDCLLVYVGSLALAFFLRFRAGRWKTIKMVSREPAAS